MSSPLRLQMVKGFSVQTVIQGWEMCFNVESGNKPQGPPTVKMSSCPGKSEGQVSRAVLSEDSPLYTGRRSGQ